MPDTFRAFIAVEVSEAVRSRAATLIERLAAVAPEVKWVQPQILHLTLKFLGDTPATEIPTIASALHAAAEATMPMEIQILGCGAFPSPGRPRTIWAGVTGGVNQLAALVHAIEVPLAALGFPKEWRKFEPHLTLGRVRGSAPRELGNALRQQATFDAGRFRVEELVLFSSLLGPKGPTYHALDRARLGAGSRPAADQ